MNPENLSKVLAALEALAEVPEAERVAEAKRRLAGEPGVLAEVLASLPYLSGEPGPDEPLRALDFEWRLDFEGMELGRYKLGPIIGMGGVGIVHRAHDTELDRTVAVKVLHPSFAVSPVAQERFAREFRSAAALEHESIARVYDSGEVQGLQFCVMELIEGSTSLQKQELTPRRAAEVMVQVCRGLQHSHAAGVIHRDIKPGNILLTPEGTPKIVDFGLAQDERFAVDRLTRTGELAGTLYYMSPEQVARRKQPITPLTDVYSAGAVFYELLMRRPPHDGQTSIQIFESIRDEVPRRIDKSIPIDLATICYKALRKSPTDRYASAGAMADDLERFLRGDAILAKPEGLSRRVLRYARRPWMQLSAIGVLLALCLAWGVGQSQAAMNAESDLRDTHQRKSERNAVLIEKLLNRLPDEYNPTNDPRFPATDPDKEGDQEED
jgi:eukaryotic-like serine/threonine-protein kinase